MSDSGDKAPVATGYDAEQVAADHAEALDRAAEAIANASCLLFTCGAGHSVDSGLPDFRGANGFWRAYPAFKGKDFAEVSNGRLWTQDYGQILGFMQHRHELYTSATPHDGYRIIRDVFAAPLPGGYFVFSSNVDGHFQVRDMNNVVECHGAVRFWQCVDPDNCTEESKADPEAAIWPTPDDFEYTYDHESFRSDSVVPCKFCGGPARVNILSFGDWGWNSSRTDEQTDRYYEWLSDKTNESADDDDFRLVVVEVGAGKAVPTVRMESEDVAKRFGDKATLVRINPADSDIGRASQERIGSFVPLAMRGLHALTELESRVVALRAAKDNGSPDGDTDDAQ